MSRRKSVPGTPIVPGLRTLSGLAVLLGPLALAACGPAEVSVYVALGGDDDPQPLDGIEVQILPYDRDAIFDSLEAAAASPEPAMPEDLIAARDEIAAAQTAWRDEETRWGELRDRLQTINEELERLNQGERRYRELFAEWEDLNRVYESAERNVGRLFDEFNELQQATIGRFDSMRIVQGDWADQAFEDFELVRFAKIEMSGLEAVYDTTGTEGVADFLDGVAPGAYWVHARYELVYDELYWNVPVEVTTEEPCGRRLRRENAELRPIY